MPSHPKTPLPFGSWRSPVTADLIAGATIRLGQVALRGSDIFWTEGRPQEQGRNVLVQRRTDGSLVDVNPAPFNVRTRAHEYGGGAFVLLDGAAGDGIVFSHDDDQQLYRVTSAGVTSAGLTSADLPQPLTTLPHQRYADAICDARRNRLIAVCEDHRARAARADAAAAAAANGDVHTDGPTEAVATLVSVALDTGVVEVLAAGHDFFSSPALSPDGRCLAWLTWDHPDMPWDGTQLWLADVNTDGALGAARCVAGNRAESICQPMWSPRGELHFVSDRSGWWNLYRLRGEAVQALHPMAAEFGQPQWAFGMHDYGFDTRGRIVCRYDQGGVSHLAVLDADSYAGAGAGADAGAGSFETLATPFCRIDSLQVGAGFAVFIGATPTEPSAVVRLDLDTRAFEVLRASSTARVEAGYCATAEAITFPTEGGMSPPGRSEGEFRSAEHEGRPVSAHAFYYPPTHPTACGPDGGKPPLIVISHGGPTGASDSAFKWGHQYWTSRGFGVVDVNYGGSSGYGRAYRARLDGQWGVVDVDDAVNAARFLVARGDVDGDRVAIRGGSAGGYTTLCALTFRDFFKAGASHYGIGDLEALATDTHKFESRYLERLIGPYPQAKALYVARSPVHFTDRLSSPMILLQGAEDKAVPPSQAQTMFNAVNARGLPVAYLLFEGEQHGFRRAATIKRALEAELYFYGKVFGFTPADPIEPVDIRNLPG